MATEPQALPREAPERPLLAAIFPESKQTVPAVGDYYVVSRVTPNVLDFHDGYCTSIELTRADLPRATVDDDAIRQALRPIRGCATDDQYVDVFERVMALVSTPRATELTVEAAGSLISDLQVELAFYFGAYHDQMGHKLDAARCKESDCERIKKLLYAPHSAESGLAEAAPTNSPKQSPRPCPWCRAVPRETDLAPSQRYVIEHRHTCYLFGRMVDMRGNSRYVFIPLNQVKSWNAYAMVAETELKTWDDFIAAFNRKYPRLPVYDTSNCKFYVQRAVKFLLTGSVD